MARPKIPNQRKANIEHIKRTEHYAQLIQKVYDQVAQEAARIAYIAGADPSKPFSFSDYPLTKEAAKQLQAQLMSDVRGIVMAGTSAEWKESNLIQDLVAKKVLRAYTHTSKIEEEYARYFQTNPTALAAFQQRKDEGMNLSTRVWNLSEQYKSELEEAITAAIAPGTSAMELASEVKMYLNEPAKRFRRIKEKMADGTIKWHLSNPAKAYHPGRGVYRSSARNAQRLARTEINMAYRTAEHERWKQFDFVVGYEVKTTQNGHHVEDICDLLAGKYPKDFKFTGWHPQCMCYCIPILKTEEEFWTYDPENPEKSENEITELPPNFREWVDENRERIEVAEKRGKLPYFIRDNQSMINNISNEDQDTTIFDNLSKHERYDNLDDKGLAMSFFYDDYESSPASQFDFIGFKSKIDGIFQSYGIDDLELSINEVGKNGFCFQIQNDSIDIQREFIFEKGDLVVKHTRFELPTNLQGKGISKAVFRELYKEYERMGVSRIDIHANLDIGGYTWSRYGFCALDRDWALLAVPYDNEAIKIINDYYKTNGLSYDKPFPMNLISDKLGKEALLNSSWEGVLDFRDKERLAKFKSYLGLK